MDDWDEEILGLRFLFLEQLLEDFLLADPIGSPLCCCSRPNPSERCLVAARDRARGVGSGGPELSTAYKEEQG